MSTPRVPPGRAGRLRLRRRLAAAERGADLLERKLRALLGEQRARHCAAEDSTRVWSDAAADADQWLVRALAASGQGGLRRCVPAGVAGVAITEKDSMGVRYPSQASCELPEAGYAAESAALICAQAAYARAARAAVQAAVDQAAVRVVDAAVTATRRQVRILRRHWIPELHAVLARLEFALEQSDFEDGVRRRHRYAPGPTALVGGDARRDASITGTEKGGG
jgi:V/A-type H+-transporting ATPase subunit D